jgi:hypothetical protein
MFKERSPRLKTIKRRKKAMQNLEKFNCKGTLRQVFICPRPRTRYHSPLYTLCTQVRGGGEVEPERRGKGRQGGVQITKLG